MKSNGKGQFMIVKQIAADRLIYLLDPIQARKDPKAAHYELYSSTMKK